ncbi:MAG: sugar transferase [Planctomycetota bacterium]
MKDSTLLDVTSESDSSISNGVAASAGYAHTNERVGDGHAVALQRGLYFRRKGLIERVLSGALLLASAPVIVLLIVIVRLTSKGPGIYRQSRVGLHGEEFEVFKLRTMYNDAEADGVAKWAAQGDSRITPVGAFLRKTHLDELPQLWNVVRGEMSLTGPRPERPSICEKLAGHIDDYYRRTAIKPGVTGLAQINLEPDRSIDDVRRKQCLDLHYIETANAWLDLRMLLATVMRMFGLKGSFVMSFMGLCRRGVLEEAGLLNDSGEPRDCRSTEGQQAESFEVNDASDKRRDAEEKTMSNARAK